MEARKENVTLFQTQVGKSIEEFLFEKSMNSLDTEDAYRKDINKFLKKVFDKSIYNITKEELESLDHSTFKKFLYGMFNIHANSTINRCASSIKSMYKYLVAEKVIEIDFSFFTLIPTLKDRPNSYEVIPIEVMLEFVKEVENEKHKAIEKKWAIILAVEIGLRETEIRNLTWANFKVDGEIVHVSGYGKGGEHYTEKISKKNVYDPMVEELKVEGQKNLFTLTKKNLCDMMNRIKKKLGYEDRNYTFHSFKKNSVTTTYKISNSITAAQKKGKHKKLETTQIYLEEEDTLMTGYFSLAGNLNQNLHNEVSHSTLLEGINSMSKEFLFILNLKLNGIQ